MSPPHYNESYINFCIRKKVNNGLFYSKGLANFAWHFNLQCSVCYSEEFVIAGFITAKVYCSCNVAI